MSKVLLYRLWHTARLYLIPRSGKRADYILNHHIFHHIGNNCTMMERKVPLCPQLISLGNNVHLASKMLLIPHDAIHLCLNNLAKSVGGGLLTKKKSDVLRLAITYLLVPTRRYSMM